LGGLPAAVTQAPRVLPPARGRTPRWSVAAQRSRRPLSPPDRHDRGRRDGVHV